MVFLDHGQLQVLRARTKFKSKIKTEMKPIKAKIYNVTEGAKILKSLYR